MGRPSGASGGPLRRQGKRIPEDSRRRFRTHYPSEESPSKHGRQEGLQKDAGEWSRCREPEVRQEPWISVFSWCWIRKSHLWPWLHRRWLWISHLRRHESTWPRQPDRTGIVVAFAVCVLMFPSDWHTNTLSTFQKITVDLYYATNSTQWYWVYVDLTMQGQEFQLQSDSGPIVPRMSLVNITGKFLSSLTN